MMPRHCYSLLVRTIEQVRLQNFQRLVEEIAGELKRAPTNAELGLALGISSVYAWQLRSGKRETIDSSAARKMEVKYGKSTGWMDTDFDLWPFPDIDPDRLDRLKADQRIEIQGLVRDRLEKFEEANAAKAQRTLGKR